MKIRCQSLTLSSYDKFAKDIDRDSALGLLVRGGEMTEFSNPLDIFLRRTNS